jgi:CRP/FNR family transcriptional regulator, anaerobic regulatory protein
LPFSDFPLHRPELLDSLRRGDARLAQEMPQRTWFKKGDEIIRTGASCDTVFRLETGWAARTRLLEDGRRSMMTVFCPGELFGVKCFLLREQPDSIHALTTATAASMKHDRLRQLFQTEATVALRVAFQLGEDERRLHNYVIGLGRANAAERLAMMLIDLHGRLVRAGLCENGSYACPLTQQDMGDFLGLTFVHVNRVLRQMHLQGIATVSRGLVQIHDLPALHKLALPVLDIFERSRPEFGGRPDLAANGWVPGFAE